MKLTRKQRCALESILYHLKRADKYLMADGIAIAHRTPIASTTLHYFRADGKALYEVNKDYGSDLTGLKCFSTHLLSRSY